MTTQRQSKKRPPWNLANRWRRLTEPAAAIREPERRRRARLLSSLLLVLIPLGILAIGLTLSDTRFILEPAKDTLLYTTLIATIVLVIAYGLSRTTRYTLAAVLTVSVVFASIFVTANIGAANVYLHYLIIGAVMSNLFFSWRGTALVLVATLVGTLLFSVFTPTLPWWDIVDALYLVVAVGMLVVVSAAVHQGDLEQIERLQRQNEQILDSAGEGILGLDLEGKHTFANPAAARMLGYKVEELIGKPSHSTWHHTKADGTLYPGEECLIYAALKDGTIHHVDGEVFWRKDGASFPVEYTSTPIREGDKIVGAVATFRDVTERKQAEEALRKSRDELEIRVAERTAELTSANAQLQIELTERKQAEDAEHEQRTLAEALRDAAAALNSTLDFEEVLERILTNVNRVVPHDAANIMLIDAATGIARVAGCRGYAERGVENMVLALRVPTQEVPNLREMMETKQPLAIPNTKADPDWRDWPETQWIRSYIGAPIQIKGAVIGFINLDSATLGFFSTRHAAHLQAFADQAAIALENARLLAESQQRAAEMSALQETALDLVSHLETRSLLETIIRRATDLLGGTGGVVYQWEEPTQQLRCTISHDLSHDYTNVTLQPGEGMAGRVYQTGQPLVVNDYAHWEGRAAHLRDIPSRGVICVPILWQSRVIGTININDESGARAFDDRDVRLLSLFANQAATAIENARLYAAVQQESDERKRYEFIVNTSHELMTLIDRDRRYKAVNAAYSQAHNRPTEEIIGRTVAEVWGEEVYQTNIKPHMDRCFAGHIEQYQEWFPFANAEPRCFNVTYYPYLGQAGTVTQVVVVSHDITELKRAEEALRESEKRFESLFEDSPISLWEEDFSLVATHLDELRRSGITDLRAYFESHPETVVHCATMVKVVDVNKATLKLFKAKSKEDLLADLSRVFSDESFPTFGEELIAVAEGETRFEGEAINRTLTGDLLQVTVSWSVAPGHEKTYAQVFVSVTDITGRKQAEEKLATKVTELEQRSNEIRLLSEMGDLLQACHTVEEASTVVAQFAQKIFPNQSGALCLIAPSRNFVEAVATWGAAPPQERVFLPDDCWALRRGQVYSIVDPRAGLLCKHVSAPVNTGCLCVPMMAHGETLGILHLLSGEPGPSQTQEEQAALMASQQQLAVTLAEHIALALANLNLRETLRQQAIRDPLTGLFNRRYMEETLERELHRAERRQVPLGIILFDLDHFKKFNDTFGHPAGDVVLREIGAFLQTSVRAEDIGCRYGGEEFIVILPEAALEDTTKRAEQLREGVKRLHVRYHDEPLGAVTVSLGVAVFPEHGSTAEAILKATDVALYRAKREGRDRVVVASGQRA